jgi:hypothetical protein
MKNPGRLGALGAVALSLAIVHCASTDAFDYYACPADGVCPAPLVCSPDRICAPAEVCGDIRYSSGALILDGGTAPQDTDLDGRLGCADPQCAGKSCQSGAGCMTGETCLADGGCGGGTFCGGPVPVCHRAEGVTCSEGTCEYPLLDAGTPCDGGYCDPSGTCQRLSYAPSNFQVAQVIDRAQAPLNVVCDSTFDTSTLATSGCLGSANLSPLVLPNGDAGELVVIASKDLTLAPDASITLTGERPLVFAVFGDARIDGQIFAGAQRSASGPGGRDCGLPLAVSGAGGGGGGYATPGGSGGAAGVDGGAVIGPSEREPLVGGCAGGSALSSTGLQAGGGAGGALQISASGTMQIRGVLAVPGGGGQQGAPDAGGAGGGSGGELLLEADSVVLDSAAALTANGGSGGTGRTTALGATPYDGEDGHPADAMPATTPDPGANGGSGGAGAARDSAATDGTTPSCALASCTAGGGGGGLGRIEVRAPNGCTRGPGTTLSPDVPSCAGP